MPVVDEVKLPSRPIGQGTFKSAVVSRKGSVESDIRIVDTSMGLQESGPVGAGYPSAPHTSKATASLPRKIRKEMLLQ